MARPRGIDASWIGVRPTPAATVLLVATVASYLVMLFIQAPQREWLAAQLGLVPREALGPRPWQLVTSWLVHTNFMQAVSDTIGIWFIATTVEQQLGRTRMLTVFGAAQVGGALAYAALGRLIAPDAFGAGSWPAITGLLAAFGVAFSGVKMNLFGLAEMRGRTIAMLFIGLSALVAVMNRDWLTLAGDAAAAAIGVAVMSGGGLRWAELQWNRAKLKRMKRRYRVIDGGRDSKTWLN